MTFQANIEAMIDDFSKKQAEFANNLKKELKNTFKQFFDAVPECTAVIWTQYAPYFNDGEECIFSVHSATFTNAADPDDIRYGEYEGDDETVWTHGDDCYGDVEPPAHIVPALNALDSLIQNDELESIFKTMFGNHVKVIATREGFKTEQYDHD
jgi:hypothetical protein